MTTGRINQVTMVQAASKSLPPSPEREREREVFLLTTTQCAEAQGVVNATNVITKVQKLLTVANL